MEFGDMFGKDTQSGMAGPGWAGLGWAAALAVVAKEAPEF